MRRRPYPKYATSGVGWRGAVPQHWEVRRLKYVASINDETLAETTESDYEFEYVDIGNVDAAKGIVGRETHRFEHAPSRARRIVRAGDTIVSTVRTYLRAIAAIREPQDHLIVSTGFAVVRPREIESGYLSYVLRSPCFVETVVSRSTGVSYPAINASEIGSIEVMVPSVAEQQAIAAFLDRETAKIDALVEKKRRLIELLKEKHAALISHAVTKGLNPHAPMKDSGIDWLGMVPERWRIEQLRRAVCRFVDYRGRTPTKTDFGVPLVTAGAVKDGDINHSLVPEFISEDDYDEWMRRGLPEAGDIVITTEAPLGEVAKIVETRVALAQRIILFKINRHLMLSDFLRYFYLSGNGRSELLSRGSGSTATGIRADRLRASLVVVPPLEEQQAIVSHLNVQAETVLKPVRRVEQAIDRLLEYRTALISAAVTGKIDVRGEVGP